MKELWGMTPSLKVLLRKQKPVPGRYRWSQFGIRFEARGRSFLYNTLTSQCLELERGFCFGESYSLSEILENPVLYSLFQDYHLVPENKDEASFYRQIYRIRRSYVRRPGFSHYMILPTWACNARCIYCFEEGMPRTTMTDETVLQTEAFLLSSRRKGEPVHLKWFGGEPLLGEKIIDRITSCLLENHVDFQSVMTTNGSLITEETADKMAGAWHMKRVKISFDCAEREYIRRKNYPVYQDTYHRVMENINLLMRRGISVNIRCNIDEGNMEDVPGFLSDLEKIVEKKEELTVAFSPLHASAESEESRPLLDHLYEARKLAVRRGFQAAPFGKREGFRVNHCQADNPEGSVVIAPTGELYACSFCEPGTAFGNVADGITRPEIFSGYLEGNEPLPKCRDCVFLPCCTAFDKCPISQYYCKENQMRYTMDMLREKTAAAGKV